MKRKTTKTTRLPIAKPKPTSSKREAKVSAVKKVKSAIQPSSIIVGLHKLKAPLGAHKHKKVLGRGSGSGHGKTSTRGSKGQTSRAGRDFYSGFEGGQTPLIRRIPKRGFTSKFPTIYQIINLRDLGRIKEEVITLDLLLEKRLIKDKEQRVKILGDGEIKNAVTVQAHAVSKQAADKIAKAGGKIELINA